MILNFGLTFIFANSLSVRELFTTSLITLLFTMIYVGIKKKMMYRILDLVAISFTLAGLSIISKVGIIVSVVVFLILLVLLFVNSVKKKRICAGSDRKRRAVLRARGRQGQGGRAALFRLPCQI